jgi:hypothetical protein
MCIKNTIKHSTAQHSTAQHSTAQHSTAQHSTAQHSTAQHSTNSGLIRVTVNSYIYMLIHSAPFGHSAPKGAFLL